MLLDAAPGSFCEGMGGHVSSLQLTDMKNIMKLEPKTYSTPASFLTKSGGRFGVPTGLFAMVPHASLFLGQLNANCFFAAPEVLQLPGSVGVAADVFSVASIFVWCITGSAPSVLMSPSVLASGCYSDKARALVPQLMACMHETVQNGDTLITNSSAACKAIESACSDVPALAALVIAALKVVPEQRPNLEELSAAVDTAMERLGLGHITSK